MRERTKIGLYVLEAALLLGLLGDALLRATPWGLNLFMWIGALVVAATALLRRNGKSSISNGGRWLLPCVLIFAAGFMWRDSPVLEFLDVLAILVMLVLATARASGWNIRLAGLMEYVLAAIIAGCNALLGCFPLLISDVQWKEISRSKWSRYVMQVARGLIIAVPLLFIFGALFMAADAIFEGLVHSVFNFNEEQLFGHFLMFAAFAWISGGFLRGMLFGSESNHTATKQTLLQALGFGVDYSSIKSNEKSVNDAATADAKGKEAAKTDEKPVMSFSGRSVTDDARVANEENSKANKDGATTNTGVDDTATKKDEKTARPFLSLGIAEIGIVLGLINTLFFCFVLVQIRYFFGGAMWVASSAGLTYAEYARRGFFELVTVAALVLPILLAAHWLLRKENPAHERIFRGLAGTLLVLLFVIMASAMGRMRLYQSEYGLTELRIYTTAFMIWLGVVFVWFAATVLRGKRERFAYGALVAGLVMIGSLHLLNPDAFIVRKNIEHMKSGRSFDVRYIYALSTDAVPALIDALPALNARERSIAARVALDRSKQRNTDWRTWNWSRAEARRIVREHEALLVNLARAESEPTQEMIDPDNVQQEMR